jgi:2-polyprenyl-6-methoxyphenol hydroxylase-like FAD-dependent oxidoreductase
MRNDAVNLACLAPKYDAVIVGARCAGAAVALLLARRGLSVLAVDRSPYGSDTLSTHALLRGSVAQLDRWGVLSRLRAAGTPAIRRVVFDYGGDRIEVPVKPRDGADALYAPRRTILDARLVDGARHAGATVIHGPRVTDLQRDACHRVNAVRIETRPGIGRTIRAGIVIGADGAQSTIARLVGAGAYRTGRHASGFIYGYWPGLPPDAYQWLFEAGARRERTAGGVAAGIVPTNSRVACLFVSMPVSRLVWDLRRDLAGSHRQILSDVSPALARHLNDVPAVAPLRGYAGHPGYLRQSWGPGWALVGDAGYFRDPITSHGMTDALRDAELLARAVGRGTDAALPDYQDARDEQSEAVFEATDEIASYEWSLERLQELHHIISSADRVSHLELAETAVPVA